MLNKQKRVLISDDIKLWVSINTIINHFGFEGVIQISRFYSQVCQKSHSSIDNQSLINLATTTNPS